VIVCILDVASSILYAANFKQGLESKCYYASVQLDYLKQSFNKEEKGLRLYDIEFSLAAKDFWKLKTCLIHSYGCIGRINLLLDINDFLSNLG
jgi:hypothetical protein